MRPQSTLVKEKKISAVSTEDGAGVSIKRLFPSPGLGNYDPFVLLDEFFLGPSAGFPQHPHRGFEAITYMLEGGFRHRDTLGNDSTIVSGGVQRFSAGGGLEHSEMPATEGLNHGLQLWVNLPRSLKNSPPDYQQVEPPELPSIETDEAFIRTVVGKGSPVRTRTPIVYLDVILKSRKTFVTNVPRDFRGFIYLVSGTVQAGHESLVPEDAFMFEEDRAVELYAYVHSRFMVIAGMPHHEPIRQHGSFVD